MDEESKRIFAELKKARSTRKGKVIARFILNCLGDIPYFSGVFGASAISSVWSEIEQAKFNKLTLSYLEKLSDRISELEKTLVLKSDPKEWVAAYIKFNPNTAKFIDSSNVLGIIDNGYLDYTVSFDCPLSTPNYIFQCFGFGSSKVELSVTEQTENHIRLKFEEPCPDLVILIFLREIISS